MSNLTVLRSVVDAGLRYSPFQPVFRYATSKKLAVLAYHGIEDESSFARHLDYVASHAHPVSVDNVVDSVTQGTELPRSAVLLSFDDGDRTVLETAAPMLERRGIPAIAFIVAGLLDKNEPLWWEEVKDLVRLQGITPRVSAVTPSEYITKLKVLPDDDRLKAIDDLRNTATGLATKRQYLSSQDLRLLEAAGIAIGNHSLTHPILDRCPTEKIDREITESHRLLTDATGKPPRVFAYPNGNWHRAAEARLSEIGYQLAFLFDHQPAALPIDQPLRTSRLRVNSTTSIDRLALILSGLHTSLNRARTRLRSRRRPGDSVLA